MQYRWIYFVVLIVFLFPSLIVGNSSDSRRVVWQNGIVLLLLSSDFCFFSSSLADQMKRMERNYSHLRVGKRLIQSSLMPQLLTTMLWINLYNLLQRSVPWRILVHLNEETSRLLRQVLNLSKNPHNMDLRTLLPVAEPQLQLIEIGPCHLRKGRQA